ncbi:hypothetical protein ACRARG_04335 [Pseudooceanicola sp. C21-150M6]
MRTAVLAQQRGDAELARAIRSSYLVHLIRREDLRRAERYIRDTLPASDRPSALRNIALLAARKGRLDIVEAAFAAAKDDRDRNFALLSLAFTSADKDSRYANFPRKVRRYLQSTALAIAKRNTGKTAIQASYDYVRMAETEGGALRAYQEIAYHLQSPPPKDARPGRAVYLLNRYEGLEPALAYLHRYARLTGKDPSDTYSWVLDTLLETGRDAEAADFVNRRWKTKTAENNISIAGTLCRWGRKQDGIEFLRAAINQVGQDVEAGRSWRYNASTLLFQLDNCGDSARADKLQDVIVSLPLTQSDLEHFAKAFTRRGQMHLALSMLSGITHPRRDDSITDSLRDAKTLADSMTLYPLIDTIQDPQRLFYSVVNLGSRLAKEGR